MKKALLWGMGECFRKYIAVIKYYEWSQQFCVVGVTSNMSIYDEYYGYKYINKNQINDTEFDFIIILADDPDREIYREAIGKGIAGEYILNYRVLMLPGFDLNRCTALKRNPPSIFSNNCWGGFTYHSLDLEFTSPFINLSVEDTDYMKLLKNPKHYMQEELQWISMVLNRGKKFYYPLVKCGDITLHFKHYKSFEEGKLCWERRKQRINWDNLFVMMYTENKDIASEFTKLPYEKKVCFVPFESKEKSLVQVEFRNKGSMRSLEFRKIVTGMAMGRYPYYSVLDLIEKAEILPIVSVCK